MTILVIAMAACFLILREEDQDKWLVHLGWLRFVLSVIVLLCFVTVLVTTLFLSFNLWIYQGEKEFFSNTSSCYSNLLDIKIPFLCFLIRCMEVCVDFCRLLPMKQSIVLYLLLLLSSATVPMTNTTIWRDPISAKTSPTFMT